MLACIGTLQMCFACTRQHADLLLAWTNDSIAHKSKKAPGVVSLLHQNTGKANAIQSCICLLRSEEETERLIAGYAAVLYWSTHQVKSGQYLGQQATLDKNCSHMQDTHIDVTVPLLLTLHNPRHAAANSRSSCLTTQQRPCHTSPASDWPGSGSC